MFNVVCFLVDAMVLYLEAVARSVPDMPLYYYHNPPVTGVDRELLHSMVGVLVVLL